VDESNPQLVMENDRGEVIRTFSWDGNEVVVVHRQDNRRVEIYPNLIWLNQEKVPYTVIQKVSRGQLATKAVDMRGLGRLRLVTEVTGTIENVGHGPNNDRRVWWRSFALAFFVIGGFMAIALNAPRKTPALEEELKQHVIRIVKRAPKMVQKSLPQALIVKKQTKVKPTKVKRSQSVRRMGALGVLGRLKKSQQYGGINLDAVKTSPGPGLGGGTGGSGGVQKTLYGKGIIAAPVGAAGNIKGAGGYGTKGKGGGRDGYGSMSLIGSAGSAPVPLGREAIIQGGLDRDMIAAVIQKNMGQIRFCYEQGLQADSKLAGRVAVDFTINGNGLVTLAGVGSSTLNSKMVEDCILLRLKSWKFPMPEGGVDVKVSYPFLLRRLGRG